MQATPVLVQIWDMGTIPSFHVVSISNTCTVVIFATALIALNATKRKFAFDAEKSRHNSVIFATPVLVASFITRSTHSFFFISCTNDIMDVRVIYYRKPEYTYKYPRYNNYGTFNRVHQHYVTKHVLQFTCHWVAWAPSSVCRLHGHDQVSKNQKSNNQIIK